MYAVIRAGGATADAYHITPAAAGRHRRRAAQRAMVKASAWEPADIDHVNAHATSTPEGDRPNCRPSARFWATMPRRSRSRPTRACSATRWGPPGIEAARAPSSRCAIRVRPANDRPCMTRTTPRRGSTSPRTRPSGTGSASACPIRSGSPGGQNTALIFRRWNRDGHRRAPGCPNRAAPRGGRRAGARFRGIAPRPA